MAEDKAMEELAQFLKGSERPELRISAMSQLSGMVCDATGVALILRHKWILKVIFGLLNDEVQPVSDDAYKAAINLSADDKVVECIIQNDYIIQRLLTKLADPKSSKADEVCKILCNLTRTENGSLEFLKKCRTDPKNVTDEICLKSLKLKDLVEIFRKPKFNENGASLDHIASVLANVSQTAEGRRLLLDRDDPVISHLLPFLKHGSSSVVRRSGISMMVKNCCFDHEHHEWLLGDAVEILPHLLLPLAGPEEFDEEENDSLPLDLQYLPDDKEREPVPAIRRTLLESLLLLCADKFGRKFLKDSGTYYIIRELHNWETEHGAKENDDHCENLIQILIGDEPEVGMENLMEIPDEKLKELEQYTKIK